MDTQAEQVLQTALGLSPNDRAEIAASLIESLDEETEQDVEAAWADEIKRRLDSIDKGEVELIPWDEALRSMRERLNG
ncbi:MAG: addiction module protein [Planctomycetes bacterium]|nr:addiction module protein [Planctomycetota bacterium]